MHYLSQHNVNNFGNSANAAMKSTDYPTRNAHPTSGTGPETQDKTTATVCSNSNCVEEEDNADNRDNDEDYVFRRNTGTRWKYFFLYSFDRNGVSQVPFVDN